MRNTNLIKNLLEQNIEKRKFLFSRGFYFTDKEVQADTYPFFGNWKLESIGTFKLLIHPQQKLTIYRKDGKVLALIGHAYDPIKELSDESEILGEIIRDNLEEINNLTGVFTLLEFEDSVVNVYGDPTGMQTVFFSCANGIQLSSHTNLIGDLSGYEWDEYARELVSYRFFPLLGNSMPGDLTQFKELKRLTPNHKLVISNGKIDVKRFFWPSKHNLSNEEICDRVSGLLKSNLALCAKKWHRPSISLTGGCDSKTTLACANGLYDGFQYFSYISSAEEAPDAEAARNIAHSLNLSHEIDNISEHDEDFDDIEITRAILYHNTGSICDNNPNDVRKRCYYAHTQRLQGGV